MKIFKKIKGGALRVKKWFLKLSLVKKIITVTLILGVAYFAFNRIGNTNNQPEYLFQKVERRNIEQIVSETGNVNSSGIVDVYSSSTGIIEVVYIENGAEVKAGQNLFKVRSTATDQEKAAAFATYQGASSAYNQALNTYRDREATAQKVEDDVKDHDSDETFAQKALRTTAQAARDSAYDAIAAAEASLKSAELAYFATQNIIVRAPASGTVANFLSKAGDHVVAGNSSTGGIPVLVVGNFSRYTVTLELNEVDIPKVKVDQSATFTLDAFPGKKFQGKVTHVDTIGINANGVITYTVVVEIIDPESSIRSMMTANVDIVVDKAENALIVPNSAIKPYQGGKAVQVIDPQTDMPKYIPVEVGIKSPERTQIISGVEEGMEVITGAKNGVVEANGGGPFGR
ncbi:MAG: efflux RND transporter periplasmic adaptor subunit [Candidatus Shapirobacteria bacterium]